MPRFPKKITLLRESPKANIKILNKLIPGKVIEPISVPGLSTHDVLLRRQQFGRNVFQKGASRSFIQIVWDIVKEPMFILLVIACSLYFILGEISEGIMVSVFPGKIKNI